MRAFKTLSLVLALCVSIPALGQEKEITPDKAQKMLMKATKSIAAAKDAGVNAERLGVFKKGLTQAQEAFDAGKFNRARALARTVAGDAAEARAAMLNPKKITFSVSVDRDRGTHFVVDKGTVEVTAKGIKTPVNSGEAIRIDKGQPAQKIAPIAAPTPEKPGHGTIVYGVVKLQWTAVTGAGQFGIDVATDPSFHHRVLIGRTQKTTFLLPTDLENGTYFWRVKGYNAQGLAGMPSAARRFDFAAGETKPKVDIGEPVWGRP